MPLHREVEQDPEEIAAFEARISRSASDLPKLRVSLQDQDVTLSNAGLFELLEG